ncbi:PIN domain-containing protein [Litoribacter ruber]|uniref:PIN domain-containing protein n=1 Tax=Litoribacter ruber TaxID=702568 RepID=UPI001BD934B1|nr:PIN domain-containing protein [Litoribacter ruber]MBT0812750.1 PIN domain-containing protein [Litoribacter ruber]
MKNVLIDTDIILDFFFDRKPFSDDAAKILALCEAGEITGYITPVIIRNIYYLLRQTAKHETVIDKLKDLMSFIEVLIINKEVVQQSLRSSFRDFEDALQNYSAESAGKLNVIITRNVKDFKHSKIGVMTPEGYLKMID